MGPGFNPGGPFAARGLEKAIAERKPLPGLVHHSDRGVQYAAETTANLATAPDDSRMSRPANPYDNASCESFMKTLKREEIYANDYGISRPAGSHRNLHRQYYNQQACTFGVGLYSPEEFEQEARPGINSVERQ